MPSFASVLQNASQRFLSRHGFDEKNGKNYKRTPHDAVAVASKPQLRDPNQIPAVREAAIQPIDLALLDVRHVLLDMNDFQILLREIQERRRGTFSDS